MDGTQVGILEKTDEVSLAGLLQSHDGRALEAKVGLEVLSDLTNQALEGQLSDEQLGGLLVTTDLTQSNCSWPVAVRLLHTSGGWCALAGCLGGELFAWGFASGRFTGGLLYEPLLLNVRLIADWRIKQAMNCARVGIELM